MKNFCHNNKLLLFAILMVSCAALSSESETPISVDSNNQCANATYGKLDLSKIESAVPSYNSFLLSCSLSELAPKPDQDRTAFDKCMKDKEKLASLLLTKNLDADFKDSHGSTLLMSAVISYFPDEWKEKAVITLIEKGCDISAVNNYEKTAMDLAKFEQNKKIVKILSEAMH
jgi:ankyrin repeat protein